MDSPAKLANKSVMWLLEVRRAEEVAPSIEEAIRRADLIILSIPYGEIAPLIKKYAEALRG